MSDVFGETGRQTPPSAHAVLVVGPARSGADELAQALQLLGLRVPSAASITNETTSPESIRSPWVSDFHERLLGRVNVRAADARPQAWFETGKLATQEEIRGELFEWLGTQATRSPREMVISDARLAWFLGLWKAATQRCGVDASYAVMLRFPGEGQDPQQSQSPAHGSETSRAAGWINQVLHTERATRGSRRMFLSYQDLREDWTVPVYRLGERFGLDSVHNATAGEIRRIHDLIGPRPSQDPPAWADVDVPKALRVMIDETWDQLNKLARADDEPATVHTTLDELRREYLQLYADAEQVAHSTIVAARRRKPGRAPAPAPSSEPSEQATQSQPPRRRPLRRRPRS